jgi:hypothetical protein
MRRVPSHLKEEYQGEWVGKEKLLNEGLFLIVLMERGCHEISLAVTQNVWPGSHIC